MHTSYTTPDYPGQGSSSRERYEANPAVAWLYAVVAGVVAGITFVSLLFVWGNGDQLWLFLILLVVFVVFAAIVCSVLWGWGKSLARRRSSGRG